MVGRKHDYNYDDDDAADAFDNSYESFEPFFRDDRDYPNCCSSKTNPKSEGRRMWEKILQEEVTVKSDLVAALSGIRVLADEIDNTEWLKHFQGRLSAISLEILQRLRDNAPDIVDMSTVADFNDNLLYHMRREQGLDNFVGLSTNHLHELEKTLRSNKYLGSFLTTKASVPQPAHVDFDWKVLQECEENSQSLMIGFFPLTKEGMFLQMWPTRASNQENGSSIKIEGEIIFIPYKKILIVPANTIHGGGFRTTSHEEPGRRGNLRFHLYIATNTISGKHRLPEHQTNKYTEQNDKTKELSRRYIDSKHMQTLLQEFFV